MKNGVQAMISFLLFGLLLTGCNRSDSAKHENQGSARRDPATTQSPVRQGAPVQNRQPTVTTEYAPVYSVVQNADGSTRLVETGRMPVHVMGDAGEFGGHPCTADCSGHEAGYEWAEENGIEDPDDCGGNSSSFIEGCMTYAEEYLDSQDTDEE